MIKKYFLFVFLVFSTLTVFSQSEKELEKQLEIENSIWRTENEYSKEMNVPKQWENESAVYILKSVKYIYDRPNNSIEYTKIEHERIKLLDQAAIAEFSEFTYSEDNAYFRSFSRVTNSFLVGIKIVKSNGEEIKIDVNSETVTNDKEKKIAIPSLEKGDIIDYYFYSNTIVGENDLYQYSAVENTIGTSYPIAQYKFSLETEDDFFLNFNTYNGAPKLEEIQAATKKDKKRIYSFTDQNVARNDFPKWFYPLLALPSYKFQVLFARSGKYEKKAYAFIPKEDTIIKTAVTKEEIFELYEDKFRPLGALGDVEKFLKNKDFASNEEKVKAVFYYIRHAYYTNYIEAIVLDEANIMYPYELYGRRPIVFNTDEEFVKFFTAFLKDNKIDYEIIIGTKRYNGDIKDLLLEKNIDFILKINTENPIYIEDFSPFATVNQISPYLENTNAYTLKVENRKYIKDVATIKLPVSSFKENNSSEEMNLSISSDFKNIEVNRVSSFIGHNKVSEQKEELMYYDYVYEDHTKYESTPILDRVRKKKAQEKYKKEYAALIEKLKGEQNEKSKGRISMEFDTEIDAYSFKVLQNGRFGKSDAFKYQEEFTIENDFIKTGGTNYIVDIGRFLGSQIDLAPKEKTRSDNVYMPYPRSFNTQITLQIPEGYSVSGIDNLSQNVENATGGFKSSAVVNKNQLIVTIEKYYVNYYEPSTNWPQMVAFLDAAYQFTQSKILLKKG